MLLFRPFSGQSCSWALALCDRFRDGGVDSLRFSITSVRTGGFHTHQKKPLGRLQHSLVNLARSMWQQTMKRKFIRILVVDRKSTRLNSSHTVISYAVFCLKKKKKKIKTTKN